MALSVLFIEFSLLFAVRYNVIGLDSSAGLVTRYGLDDPGIESRLGEIFSARVQTGPGVLTMGTGSFPGGWGVKQAGHGVDHPPRI